MVANFLAHWVSQAMLMGAIWNDNGGNAGRCECPWLAQLGHLKFSKFSKFYKCEVWYTLGPNILCLIGKDDHLWWPIFLPFGYFRSCWWELAGMTMVGMQGDENVLTYIVLHTLKKFLFWDGNQGIIKILIHPCYPRNFDWYGKQRILFWKKKSKSRNICSLILLFFHLLLVQIFELYTSVFLIKLYKVQISNVFY